MGNAIDQGLGSSGLYAYTKPGVQQVDDQDRRLTGYLVTQHAVTKRWERRWCVLQPKEALLLIYTTRGNARNIHGGRLVGAVNLHNARLFQPPDTVHKHLFCIKPPPLQSNVLNMLAWPHVEPEVYEFRAESALAWQDWKKSITHYALKGPAENNITTLTQEGWLRRKNVSKKIGSKWARRWFVVDTLQCALLRFDNNEDDAALTGAFNLENATVDYDAQEHGRDFTLKPTRPISMWGVRWPAHDLHLRTQTEREAREWVRALCQVTGCKVPIAAKDNFRRALVGLRAMRALSALGGPDGGGGASAGAGGGGGAGGGLAAAILAAAKKAKEESAGGGGGDGDNDAVTTNAPPAPAPAGGMRGRSESAHKRKTSRQVLEILAGGAGVTLSGGQHHAERDAVADTRAGLLDRVKGYSAPSPHAQPSPSLPARAPPPASRESGRNSDPPPRKSAEWKALQALGRVPGADAPKAVAAPVRPAPSPSPSRSRAPVLRAVYSATTGEVAAAPVSPRRAGGRRPVHKGTVTIASVARGVQAVSMEWTRVLDGDDEGISKIEQTVLRLPEALANELRSLAPEQWEARGVELSYECIDPDARRFIFRISSHALQPPGNSQSQRTTREFPATLVDMPCVLELLQTHDHADYFKTGDVGQMLLVHEGEAEREQLETRLAEHSARFKEVLRSSGCATGFCMPSGLTPPTDEVVRRNFAGVFQHSAAEFPRAAVMEAEEVAEALRKRDSHPGRRGGRGGGRGGAGQGAGGGGGGGGADWELVETSEEIVDFAPWMLNDRSDMGSGKTVPGTNALVREHPELLGGREVPAGGRRPRVSFKVAQKRKPSAAGAMSAGPSRHEHVAPAAARTATSAAPRRVVARMSGTTDTRVEDGGEDGAGRGGRARGEEEDDDEEEEGEDEAEANPYEGMDDAMLKAKFDELTAEAMDKRNMMESQRKLGPSVFSRNRAEFDKVQEQLNGVENELRSRRGGSPNGERKPAGFDFGGF
eukprot:g338.t1